MTTNEYMDDITRQALTELAGQLSDDLGGKLQDRIAATLETCGESLDARIGRRLEGDLNLFRQAWEERFARLAQDLEQHLKASEESRAAALTGLTEASREARAAADQTHADLSAVQERVGQTETRLQELAAPIEALVARSAEWDGALKAMGADTSRVEEKLDHLTRDIQAARESMVDGISNLLTSRFEAMNQAINSATGRVGTELSEALRKTADELHDRFETAAQEIADNLEATDKARQKALSAAMAEQEKAMTETLNQAADQRSARIVDRLNEKSEARLTTLQKALDGQAERLALLETSGRKDSERMHKAYLEQVDTNNAMEKMLSRLNMQNWVITGLVAVMAVALLINLFR